MARTPKLREAITRECQQSGRWIDGRGSLLQCADPGLQRIDRGPDGGEAQRIALVAFIAFGRPLRETLELPCDPRSPLAPLDPDAPGSP